MMATISPPRRSLGNRLSVWFGTLLILGGLALIGWFLWQYFGTNVVAKRAATEIRQNTIAQWDNGIEGDAVALLRVDRFGKDYEVPIVKGFDDASLAKGVGMYEKSAKPGAKGNFTIAAHRVTHGEPFRDFLKLREGDLVEVETRQKIFTYRLRNDGDEITVPFTTSWPLWKVPDPDANGEPPTERLITMLTCSELFHTDNRNVVVGELVKSLDKSKVAPPKDREADTSDASA